MPFLEQDDPSSTRHTIEGNQIDIGRNDDNDIVLTGDMRVSRRHARITNQEGLWVLQDLRSRNGVYLNGTRTIESPLRDADRIEIGGSTFVFNSEHDPMATLLATNASNPISSPSPTRVPAGLEFGILGPLLVRAETGDIQISGARRRALLVRLLLTANELVPAPRLAEDLWDGEPPPAATSTLQSHISFLRRALGSGRLVGRDGGYILKVADDELDVRLFEDELRRGRHALAAGDAATTTNLLSAALSRWRGSALTDVSGSIWAVSEEIRLEEMHLAATELWLEARLSLGEHQEVAALAEAALVEHPLREEIWGSLMLALYRSGRQADALRAFQRLRKLLGETLGIGPSAQLVALDDAIVQQKSELNWSGVPRGG
jgi:DNA-binding SARP family transcriptional activator